MLCVYKTLSTCTGALCGLAVSVALPIPLFLLAEDGRFVLELPYVVPRTVPYLLFMVEAP